MILSNQDIASDFDYVFSIFNDREIASLLEMFALSRFLKNKECPSAINGLFNQEAFAALYYFAASWICSDGVFNWAYKESLDRIASIREELITGKLQITPRISS